MNSKIILALICLLAMAIPVSASTTYTVLADEHFDNSISNYWYRAMNNYDYSGTYSQNYTENNTCFRIELHNTDALVEGGKRAEIESEPEPQFQECIYNFSIYLPASGSGEEWAADNFDCDEVIVQWHNNPDPNEEWTRPPLALTTNTINGVQHYVLINLWDNDSMSTTAKLRAEDKITDIDLGSLEGDKGHWVNWSFHIKWGWEESHNTILEVYKDGVKVVDRNGLPNTTNDTTGVNQQFGVYKWEWAGNDPLSALTSRVIYFDNVSTTLVTTISAPSVIFPGCTHPAQDLDGDGIYEDVNGNGVLDFDDITTYYSKMDWIEENGYTEYFDFNGNGIIDFDDVVKFYAMI
ncbi:MAG: heparin lyase I family protein [Methanogenium sp.]|jgi:PKD repeat protein